MKNKFKLKYPAITGLLMLIASVALLASFHILTVPAAVAIIGFYQLAMIALSAPRSGVFYITGLSQAQIDEFNQICEELKDFKPETLEKIKSLEKTFDEMRGQLKKMQKFALNGVSQAGLRWIGNKAFVSDDCAAALTSMLVLDCARIKSAQGSALDSMVPDASTRKSILTLAQSNLGVEQRAAMTGTEVPLPTAFVPQIIELVFAYGTARQYATVFPLSTGLVKLPRLKAGEDDFGYFGAGTAGQSQNITEKKVAAELVTFTANKAGGMIRLPYELQEDTFIPIGQWLARYIARQFAKLEDKTMFLADGSANYAGQTGVGNYCVANPTYLLKLDAA